MCTLTLGAEGRGRLAFHGETFCIMNSDAEIDIDIQEMYFASLILLLNWRKFAT